MPPQDPPTTLSRFSGDPPEPLLIAASLALFGDAGKRLYPAGEILVREGDEPAGIWLILDGRVELFRTIDGEDMVFHSESAGRIIGLMALSEQHPTFFSCRAREPVEALFISHQEIAHGMESSAEFRIQLVRVMVLSMSRRNRRSAQLLIKVRSLNQRLAAQRDDLESALESLKLAQHQIIESEKMASLGNLAAGMAHELNNPVAAIQRAADFIREDLTALVTENPGLETAAAALPIANQQAPLGTREEREIKSALTTSLGGDRALAASLFSSGVRSPADLSRLLAIQPALPRDHRLRQIQRGGQLGTSLRTLAQCSHRIADLVRSLKLHARDDTERIDGIDLNQTLEDTLILLADKLRTIDLHKDYGTLPPISGHPSRLQQVWLNLIVNATHALHGSGRIDVQTRLRPDGRIEVRIEDNGPGIPPEIKDRLFEHRFTTRSGRVEFGLGLGLPISRMIIENHGGHLSFQSSPGHTCFTVELPTQTQPQTQTQPPAP